MASEKTEALSLLETIFQAEMAGVMRYLHASFMIMGHNRIPIQKWFRDNATESMDHAVIIGEKITSLGGHPPLQMQVVHETHTHNVNDLLNDMLTFELAALDLYKKLAHTSASSGDIALEELAREFVRNETEHVEEVQKMLRSYK